MAAGLKTIISLSFVCPPRTSGPSPSLLSSHLYFTSGSANASLKVLAIGFLLVILSCALFKEYLPLLVVVTYVLAPLPNWICGRCSNPDDFVESGNNAVVDFGRFCTGFLVLMGVGMCIFFSFVYCFGFGWVGGGEVGWIGWKREGWGLVEW
jgi:hypothetical protein